MKRFNFPKEVIEAFGDLKLSDVDGIIEDYVRFNQEKVVQVANAVNYADLLCDDIATVKPHLWLDGVINKGSRADINLSVLGNVLDKLKGHTNYNLHLLGHGITRDYVHPAWFVKYGNRFAITGGTIYKPRQPRTEITIHVDEQGNKILYGMMFTPSNFIQYNSPIYLGKDLGMNIDCILPEGHACDTTAMKTVADALLTAQINTTEKLIQLPKNLAAVMPKFGDPADMEAKYDLMRRAASELVPKQQKALGRQAALNRSYFDMANGERLDVHDAGLLDWDKAGTNVLIQAFGAMLRVYKGDTVLRDFLRFCALHRITLIEAAVHCEIEAGPGEDDAISYGSEPDLVWGGCCVCPRMSPDCRAMEWGLDRAGAPAAGRNHLGLGHALLIRAMEEADEERNLAARRALGLTGPHVHEPLDQGDLRGKCRAVGERLFGRMFSAGYGLP